MSVTITLYLWWLLAYLGIGLVLFLPLNYVAYRKYAKNFRNGFIRNITSGNYRWTTGKRVRNFVGRFTLQVLVWPLALWEVIR